MWTSLFLQISQATCRWLCCDDWDLSSSFLAQKVLAVIEGFRENSKITSWEEKARKCRSCLQSDQSTASQSISEKTQKWKKRQENAGPVYKAITASQSILLV
jgi:hypothetical protein